MLLPYLRRLSSTLLALPPEEWSGTGLTVHRRLTGPAGPIFVYVSRLEYIEFIERTSGCRISKSPESQETTPSPQTQ